MKKLLVITLGILSVCIHLHAEVFWLTPLFKGGTSGIPLTENLPGLENASPLFREPVRINGKKFTLEVMRSGASFEEILSFLRGKKVNFAISSDTLRCTIDRGNGILERVLIVRSPGRGPVTVFRISGSGGIPQDPGWPTELPSLPPGARAVQVIEIPGRKSVYGIFDRCSGDAVQNFRNTDSMLRQQGWIPAADEGSYLIGGRGEIYRKNNSGELMWVTFNASGNGAFYRKRSVSEKNE